MYQDFKMKGTLNRS